jgi:hypothetical protein
MEVSNQILPLHSSTIPLHIANPKPVPEFLVVKLGVKIFERISSVIPAPLSCTLINTLFSISVCVDEINHHEHSLNSQLKNFWGECFYMGGLAGIPFVGKVGFGAFQAHIPKDGNLFILFAPHVGIAPDGEIGKF